MSADRQTVKLIANLRDRLLDLSNNNPLLSFKHSPKRKQVRIVDEQPDTLHQSLTTGERRSFRSVPDLKNDLSDEKTKGGKPTSIAEWARSHEIDLSWDLPLSTVKEPEKKSLDREIQTLLSPDEMQSKLSRVLDHARTAQQETGVNILHVAIGFLEWYETETVETPLLAPLLLYPVEIERRPTKGKGQYQYYIFGEQAPIINITLRQRLAKDHNLNVPELKEGDTAETYMSHMTRVIAESPRWRVRRFATMGMFSFSRLVMYNDLDPQRWGKDENALPDAGVLSELFGRKEAGDAKADAYDLEDPAVEAEVPLLIRDADSSQHQAIIDVMRGRNFVIKGPPGTGKSQTIANIIAASLAKNKTVLFVAEKAAALDVVKKYLDEVGLGDFCLELHSTKAKKADVLAGLERRLNLKPTRTHNAVEPALVELRSLRGRLARHAAAMNLPFGALEVNDRGAWRRATIHDILWAEQCTRAHPPQFPGLDRTVLPDATETTRVDADRRRDHLTAIERLVAETIKHYGSVSGHPWAFVTRHNISVLDVPDIAESAKQVRAELEQLVDEAKKLTELGFPTPSELAGLNAFAVALSSLPQPAADADDGLLKLLLSSDAAGAVGRIANLLDEHKAWVTERSKLLAGGTTVSPTRDVTVRLCRRANELEVADDTLNVIGHRAKAIRMQRSRWGELAARAEHVNDILGVRGSTTPRTLRRAVEAVDLLASVERPVLLARSPSVIDEMAGPVLERAHERLQVIRKQDARMRQRFVIDKSISVVEIRHHAEVLKDTGFLGKFGSEFKRAKNLANAIVKISEANIDVMARELLYLAEHMERIRAFEDNPHLRAVCKDRFVGIDTDIDNMLAANRFATKVRSAFAGMGEPERTIRRFLLESDVEALDGLTALASDKLFAELRQTISAAPDTDADFVKRSESLDRLADETDDVRLAFLNAGFRPDITPAQAGGLVKIIDRLAEIDAELKNTHETRLCGAAWAIPATEAGPVRAALRTSETLRASAVGDALRILVMSARPVSETVRLVREVARTVATQARSTQAALHGILEQVVEERLIDREATRLAGRPIDDLSGMFGRAAQAPDELMQWVRLRNGITAARADGLGPILDAYDKFEIPYLGLQNAYHRVLYRSLVRRVMDIHPELSEATARSLNDIRTRFRDLDQKIMGMHRQALISKLAAAPIPGGIQSRVKGECTEAALIRNEIAKKTKHIPIRDLIMRAPEAILGMKPCVLMSPASVAQFLNPGQKFDLMVIDEASQMRPEEAISALARARQAVIVGDPKQLPPSTIFERQDQDVDDRTDDEIEKVVEESILDVAQTTFQPHRELLWHYRSRHGSLIAFSNRHFYDERLIVFPSPTEGLRDYGVRSIRVVGKYRASVNAPEVDAVVKAALDFMAKSPDKSLGIVALNRPQRERIWDEMEQKFIQDPIAEGYRARWQGTIEPFFVKNLENVQGDERDVIFISTVYGPDENDKLMQRFTLINGAAGDRRLNVLFSRAKHGITVFSSMYPNQIRVDENSPRGTRLLKEYLSFADTGSLDQGHTTSKECDSDFERFVKERLEAKGYEVVAQVGVGGYRIDLGVCHKDWPYGYLLGIECDGATYHSSLSARDRDRLRQQILENLGWTIYRVWSTDWFRDQNRELAKMVDFIERTLVRSKAEHAAYVEAAAADGTAEQGTEVLTHTPR